MHFALFYQSLISDWNHGNAHFLRGVVRELQARGHKVDVFEPADGWSLRNLTEQHGSEPLFAFRRAYPGLTSTLYRLDEIDLDQVLDGVDVVIVHEWNDPALVSRIGRHRARGSHFTLLFHDTHHRIISEPEAIRAFDLQHYDGVLAFGEVLRDIYENGGWAARAWTWHEAADVELFHPPDDPVDRPLDLVWVGNWGDNERAHEISEYLIEPVGSLGLSARVHGVRYPKAAQDALAQAGIDYRGWLPNFEVPALFARAKMTVHIPRRFYAETLAGIPTIRMFEALACGIPLICAPWDDCEDLFDDDDYLIARDGAQMCEHLRMLIDDSYARAILAGSGLRTILSRHTCAHRVDELLGICREIAPARPPRAVPPEPVRPPCR
jgi:spore maturation protein CgeB